MKIRNARKINAVALLFIMLLCWAFFAPRQVSADADASIELRFGKEAAGAQMTLYALADYQNEKFVFRSAYADSGISMADLCDGKATSQSVEQMAQQLALLAKESGAQGVVGTVDADGVLKYEGLQPAYYLLVQTGGTDQVDIQKTLVPVPYTMDGGRRNYQVQIEPKYSVPDGAVILNKSDDDGASVAGAVFRLEKKVYITENGTLPDGAQSGKDVDGRYIWEQIKTGLMTNTKGQIALSSLSYGTYRFIETKAPEGYIKAEGATYFTIEKAGEITEQSGSYSAAAGDVEELTVVNKQTSTSIYKVNKKGKAVSGAKLVIKDSEGKTIETFVTDGKAHVIKQLPEGDYLLSELEAPAGYKVSEDVPFHVTASEDAENAVTMIDEPEVSTKAALQVTKTLVDENENNLIATDSTFYVALFEDEALTKRVSNVEMLHYKGTMRESVTFNNLELNKKYYVGETDEDGNVLDGIQEGDGVFAAVYPETAYVEPTKSEPQKQYTFENMFYELPSGYNLGGELTITKKVLRGSEAYNTNQVFYAGVFTDADCTELYTDLIKLDMDGGSETSVTIPVSVGTTLGSSVTYYVAETDADGNVLDASADLAYTISVDKEKVTMSAESDSETVTITNTFDEEYETEIYEEETTKTTTGKNGNTKKTATAKTGDATPIGVFVGLLLIAACVCIYLLYKMKKDQDKN